MKLSKCQIFTTPNLIKAAKMAEKHQRNRQLDTDKLKEMLDPDGKHLIAQQWMHKDFYELEWRLMIYMKMTDQTEPEEGWLDISDEHLSKYSQEYFYNSQDLPDLPPVQVGHKAAESSDYA